MKRRPIIPTGARILSLIVIFLPLMALLADAQSGWDFHVLLLDGRRAALLGRSLLFSVGAALVCSLVGFAAALGLTSPGRWSRFRWTPLVLLALPPSLHALAWDLALSRANQFFGNIAGLRIAQEGWGLALWAQVMTLLPLSLGFGMLGLDRLPKEMLEAGRVFRNDEQIFRNLAFPLLRPWIIGSGALVFILSLTDYTIPALAGCTSYALEVFSEFAAGHDPGRSFLLSIPLFLPILPASLLILTPLRLLLRSTGETAARSLRIPGGWMWWFTRAGLLLLAIQVLVPLVMLAGECGSWRVLAQSLRESRAEILYSILLSSTAALLVLIPAGFLSGIFRKKTTGPGMAILALLALAVPASLIGIGWSRLAMIVAPDSSVLRAFLPVGALSSRYAAVAILVLLAWSSFFDRDTFDALALFRRSRLTAWFHIRIPLALPALGAAAALVFAFSLTEIGASLMVLPPGRMTLSVRLYNALHYGATAQVAALSLILAAICLGAGAIAVCLLREKGRS